MTEANEPAIVVEGIVKHFGDVKALDGVDFEVPAGTILGVLGPNGAGKTTAVRVLTTLLKPDSGSARVLGLDVIDDAAELRSKIGLAGQYAAVDENLTGTENLTMVGRLYGETRADAKVRAAALLERFDLSFAADRVCNTYSGGMRRRLDLAAALVADPPVIFLDEPTTGLDPRSRINLWETIENLVSEGTTVLLTTQYLDEADRLADRIAVIDTGKMIAEGTSEELKERVGGLRVEVHVRQAADSSSAAEALAPMSDEAPQVDDRSVTVLIDKEAGAIMEAVRRLDGAGVDAEDVGIKSPTLDDVFLSLTGRDISAAEESEEAGTDREEVAS